MNGERCNFVTCEKNGWHCGSYAFNLASDGIEQGEFCDVHYWQSRAEAAENALAIAQPVQPAVPRVVADSAAQLGGGWVQVADKLPKVGVPVQVFGKIPYGRTMRVLVAYRTYDWEQEDGTPFWNGLSDHWDSRGLCSLREVSVWKPLSTPPSTINPQESSCTPTAR